MTSNGIWEIDGVHTATTESLAVTARISAQDTTPGQTLSTLDLIVSITSNPRREFALGPAVFSPVKLAVSSRRTEPSHPCFDIHKLSKNHSFRV